MVEEGKFCIKIKIVEVYVRVRECLYVPQADEKEKIRRE